MSERNHQPPATSAFSLKAHELEVAEVHHNLPPSSLYEHAIRFEKDASIAENGSLVAYSGMKTSRSPKDKRVVKHPDSEAEPSRGRRGNATPSSALRG